MTKTEGAISKVVQEKKYGGISVKEMVDGSWTYSAWCRYKNSTADAMGDMVPDMKQALELAHAAYARMESGFVPEDKK